MLAVTNIMNNHEASISKADSFFGDSSSEIDRLLQELTKDDSIDDHIMSLDSDDISVTESLKKLLLESGDTEADVPRSIDQILEETDCLQELVYHPMENNLDKSLSTIEINSLEDMNSLKDINTSKDMNSTNDANLSKDIEILMDLPNSDFEDDNCLVTPTHDMPSPFDRNYVLSSQRNETFSQTIEMSSQTNEMSSQRNEMSSQTEVLPCTKIDCFYISQCEVIQKNYNQCQAYILELENKQQLLMEAFKETLASSKENKCTQIRGFACLTDSSVQCDLFKEDPVLQHQHESALRELKGDFLLLRQKYEKQIKDMELQLASKCHPVEPFMSQSELQKQLIHCRKQLDILNQKNNCHIQKEADYLESLASLKSQLGEKQRMNITLKKEIASLQKSHGKLSRDKPFPGPVITRPTTVPKAKVSNIQVKPLQLKIEELEKILASKNNEIAQMSNKYKEQLESLKLEHVADSQLLRAKATLNDSRYEEIDELKSQIKTLQQTVHMYEEKMMDFNRIKFRLDHSNEEKAALESDRAALQMKLDWCKKSMSPKQSLLYEIQEKIYVFQQTTTSRENEFLDLIQKMRISIAGTNILQEEGYG